MTRLTRYDILVGMARIFAPLQSTALTSATYDDEAMSLDVAFFDGRTYTYENVPQKVFEELRDARSPGSYFHAYIKNRY